MTFQKLANGVSNIAGGALAFSTATGIVLLWAVTGPIFHYSTDWQLFINTGTTIVTFLMVFLIQNTQNRDSIAMQIKLDELIRSSKDAHNALLEIEELTEQELTLIRKKYSLLAHAARQKVRSGQDDLGVEPV